MFWIIGTDRKPKPAERGASQYAKPAEAPDAMPGYVPDERDRDYALQQLSTLPQYSSEQPGALAIPVPQPRHRFPWEYVFLGTAAVLALAAGTVYVASYLNNRPNAGYKAPAVRTIEKPVNAPTLVAEPGFRTPLAPTATAVPKATATPQPYRPIGNSVTVANGQVIIDCPKICTEDELKGYAANVTTVYDPIEELFGRPPERQLIMSVRTLQNHINKRDRNNSITLGSYPANPDNPDYQYFMSLAGDENGHLADELSGWMIGDLVGDSKRWFLEATSRWIAEYVAALGTPKTFDMTFDEAMQTTYKQARTGQLDLTKNYDAHNAAIALIGINPNQMSTILRALEDLKVAQGHLTDDDIKGALVAYGNSDMQERLDLIAPVIAANRHQD